MHDEVAFQQSQMFNSVQNRALSRDNQTSQSITNLITPSTTEVESMSEKLIEQKVFQYLNEVYLRKQIEERARSNGPQSLTSLVENQLL